MPTPRSRREEVAVEAAAAADAAAVAHAAAEVAAEAAATEAAVIAAAANAEAAEHAQAAQTSMPGPARRRRTRHERRYHPPRWNPLRKPGPRTSGRATSRGGEGLLEVIGRNAAPDDLCRTRDESVTTDLSREIDRQCGRNLLTGISVNANTDGHG